MGADKKPSMTTETEKPFEEEVAHPPTEGQTPTPDDIGDAKRQDEAAKTTRRQE